MCAILVFRSSPQLFGEKLFHTYLLKQLSVSDCAASFTNTCKFSLAAQRMGWGRGVVLLVQCFGETAADTARSSLSLTEQNSQECRGWEERVPRHTAVSSVTCKRKRHKEIKENMAWPLPHIYPSFPPPHCALTLSFLPSKPDLKWINALDNA